MPAKLQNALARSSCYSHYVQQWCHPIKDTSMICQWLLPCNTQRSGVWKPISIINKRELSRAHTPRAASACIWTLQEQHWSTCMCFVDDLFLRMLGELCAWAESTWPAVGAVDRRGQQKFTVCDARGPCQRNRSILKPLFRRFRRIHCAY